MLGFQNYKKNTQASENKQNINYKTPRVPAGFEPTVSSLRT